MRLTIDNLDGHGAIDYTGALDASFTPRVQRKLNQPSTFQGSLLAGSAGFVVPAQGARLVLTKGDGAFIFTGYLTETPQYEYLGWGGQGSVYRYKLIAESDEVLLDQKALPNRAPFVARSAGSALRQLVQDLLPGGFDTSAVEDVDVLASYAVNPQKKFSYHAAEIASAARASYRAMNGTLTLAPVGAAAYTISDSDANFSPAGLKLNSPRSLVNDVTLIGLEGPKAYVRDYFVGDGLTLRFYLSQEPFQQNRSALIDEQYLGPGLDPATWVVSDPSSAVSIVAQTLRVTGGNGQDGKTTVAFLEEIELGGALELQHGEVSFIGPSQGIIGGLYSASGSSAGCLAGFQVTPSGTGSNIQAIVNGSATGPVITTTAGHRYLLTTYFYSMEVFRSGETYHSSLHPAGLGYGGASVPADVRIVLELQDINPNDPTTLVAPAVVLFDDVITNAPAFCAYALIDALNMQCSIAATYVTRISMAEVRTSLPGEAYTTRLVESISDGRECYVASLTTLDFYPQYVPPLNTAIVASYRGSGRAVAEVINSASIAGLANGPDNGVRSVVRTLQGPSARTQADCENAALALLDDAGGTAWSGTYQTWNDFLLGSNDIFPGDALTVDVARQNANFAAIVRSVSIDWIDPADDRGMYTIEFANDSAESIALQMGSSATGVALGSNPAQISTSQVGSYYLDDLTNAQLTQISSTTVQVDAGVAPASNQGVEVRAHDFNWGIGNDRDLLGRFSSQTFNLPRLGRTQTYFLRLYDDSTPPRYSRYAAALHVDSPL